MSYKLNGTTLPSPYGFERQLTEIAKTNVTLAGTSRKDIVRQKEIYIIEFKNLSQSDVNTIMGIYELKSAVTFQVDEDNLTISSRNVFVTIDSRQYNSKGTDYREDLRLILEEV